MIRAVVYFGTYDAGYPRSAVALAGLRELGVSVYELRASLPPLTAAEMATPRGAARLATSLVRAHLRLVSRLRGRRPVDALIVGYPGHFMVPFGKAVASLLDTPLVFDPLVSLWDTFAGDRGLVQTGSLKASAVRTLDRIAFRLPDLVLADTAAHAGYYRSTFRIPDDRLAVTPVGALPETAASGEARRLSAGEPLTVFQYGKWSPLHGAEIVIEAADRLRDQPVRFVFAGEGQLSGCLRAAIAARGLPAIEWLGLLSPAELRARTLSADVCLGVFGCSEKAGRVVPNKVQDALSCGRPVVTSDTPGARELLSNRENALLVPPGDAEALTSALRELLDPDLRERLGREGLALYGRSLTPRAVAGRLLRALESL